MENKKYPIGGFAPGYYHCKCFVCAERFQGDKRATMCEPCAIELAARPKEVAELQDFYAGDLNTERIKEYRWLAERFTCDEGTVRYIFCRGLDFAVKHISKLFPSSTPLEQKELKEMDSIKKTQQ